jgi:hypothetical protein
MMQEKQDSAPRKKRPFLLYMHYFRAFAIINIVLLHVWRSSLCTQPETERVSYIIRHTVFSNSTIYFIFISGFLFYYLSENFNVIRYYKSKIMNVILPYVIFSSIFLIIQAYNQGEVRSIGEYIHIYLNGKAQFSYWYIPFISLIFVISPFLLKIDEALFRKVSILSCIFPLLGTRTGTEITVGQYLYFTPCYLLGILFAKDIDVSIAYIRKYFAIISVVALLSTVCIVVLYMYKIHAVHYGMNVINSVGYIQKVAITFLSILLFKRFEHKQISILNMLAAYSFAIYFLHTLVDYGRMRTVLFCDMFRQWNTTPILFAYAVLILLVTLGLSIVLKRVLGKHSRKVIGA